MISKKQGIVQITNYAKQQKFKQMFNFNHVSLQNVQYGLFFIYKYMLCYHQHNNTLTGHGVSKPGVSKPVTMTGVYFYYYGIFYVHSHTKELQKWKRFSSLQPYQSVGMLVSIFQVLDINQKPGGRSISLTSSTGINFNRAY